MQFPFQKMQQEQHHFHKLEMFFNLSKIDLIKRFHYMLTMLKVHSIVRKRKYSSVQSILKKNNFYKQKFG